MATSTPSRAWDASFFWQWFCLSLIETIVWTFTLKVMTILEQWLSLDVYKTLQAFLNSWLICFLTCAIFHLIGILSIDDLIPDRNDDFAKFLEQVFKFYSNKDQTQIPTEPIWRILLVSFYFAMIASWFYLAVIAGTRIVLGFIAGGTEEENNKFYNLLTGVMILVAGKNFLYMTLNVIQ
ncbi:uncharacterized protein LOC118437635 [Folsomia candida]|uniref:uncharacterized protein LOC118437635 n=1 Tax=Folsomia candida TaxID=158441 RepID=UPI001605014B|nr:uncharacterized protein LOC118437635 [Folsomia candida]